MTPLQIEILSHYHCCTTDYRDGDFSAPAVRGAIDAFRDEYGLLEADGGSRRTYRTTERAEAYLAHLMSVPLPVAVWTIPPSPRDGSNG